MLRLRLGAPCAAKIETFEADASHVICRRPDHCGTVSGGDRWDFEGIARKMGSQRGDVGVSHPRNQNWPKPAKQKLLHITNSNHFVLTQQIPFQQSPKIKSFTTCRFTIHHRRSIIFYPSSEVPRAYWSYSVVSRNHKARHRCFGIISRPLCSSTERNSLADGFESGIILSQTKNKGSVLRGMPEGKEIVWVKRLGRGRRRSGRLSRF